MKRAFVLVVAVLLLAAFSSSAAPSYPGAKGKKATLILKDLTNPVWIQAAEGAKAAAKDFGMQIEVTAPVVSNSNDEQIQLVQQAIAKRKDIVILTPADSKGIVPAVTELNQAKIPVINLNTKINNESGRANSETFVVADNIMCATLGATELARLAGGAGEAIILQGPSGGQVTGSGWYAESTNATVAALPNAGYLFTGFGGDLGGSATPQTLWMNGPKSVTGSFIPMPGAAMSALISSKSGAQNARQWSITLRNNGPGVAYAPQIHGLMLTQTYGTACAPLRLSPAAFPLVFANLPAGGVAIGSALFDFSACPANARFTVVVGFTANSGSSVGATTLANQTP